MAETEKFSFPSCDGMHQIHARLWLPQQPPRGVVPCAARTIWATG